VSVKYYLPVPVFHFDLINSLIVPCSLTFPMTCEGLINCNMLEVYLDYSEDFCIYGLLMALYIESGF